MILVRNPGLAKERQKPGKGIKAWDRIFYPIFSVSLISAMVVSILDTGRFGWSVAFPLWLIIIGLFVLSVGVIGLLFGTVTPLLSPGHKAISCAE